MAATACRAGSRTIRSSSSPSPMTGRSISCASAPRWARASAPAGRMVVADELEADLGRVKVLQAQGDQARFGNQDTDGSRSMRHHFEPLRRIAAAARQMLEQEAAARWGVPVTEVKAENNGIVHAASGRRLDFGALAKGAAARPVPPRRRPGPEGREPVPLHRQGQRALDRQSRHHHRQGHVRHRRARRRHGLCGRGAAAGLRRQGRRASMPPRR